MTAHHQQNSRSWISTARSQVEFLWDVKLPHDVVVTIEHDIRNGRFLVRAYQDAQMTSFIVTKEFLEDAVMPGKVMLQHAMENFSPTNELRRELTL